MLDLEARVRPNTQDVAAKVLDGEAIMINLTLGTYYSLDAVGTLVWELIESGHSLRWIVEVVTQRFEVALDAARTDVLRLVQEMLDEGVVVKAASDAGQEVAATTRGFERARELYHPPELRVYRDMADLLALEPPTPGAAQEELWEER